MNKTNPIFEALDGLNENYAAEAIMPSKKKMKTPLRIAIIAAAAAAIVMGCSAAVRSSLKFDDKAVLEFNYYPQTEAHILSAEELTSLGAIGDNRGYTLTSLPSELFARYNVTPLMNAEFFSEEKSEITVNGSSTQAILKYTLTDKESNKPITVEIQFDTNGKSSFGRNYTSLNGSANEIFTHYEVITLADGSEVFVADRYLQPFSRYDAQAVFCHNGIGYKILARNTDINEMKQILSNLGAM